MSKLYHVHVTCQPSGYIPFGWKSTEIVLEGQKEQVDVMLTKHYKIGYKGICGVSDILNDVRMAHIPNTIRIKVEQDSEWDLPITESNYAEVHMLCPPGITPNGSGWVMSRNPKHVDNTGKSYFYNRRIYSGNSMEEIKTEILLEQQGVDYSDLKIEQAIYDSNRQHDLWWA